MRNFIILFSVTFIFVSCTPEEDNLPVSGVLKEYLVIGNTRAGVSGTFIHPIVKSYKDKYTSYNKRILLGDMASEIRSLAVLDSINSVFNISNENTLWGFGHHDFDNNISQVLDYTGKTSTYYSQKDNNVLFIVLDDYSGDFSGVNPKPLDNYQTSSSSSIVGAQLDFFNKTLNQVDENISAIVVISHKLLWLWNNPSLAAYQNNLSNTVVGGENRFELNPNNFYTDIYPKLVELKNKGKQVFCLSGDAGNKAFTDFAYETTEGVVFLATGINSADTTGTNFRCIIFRNNTTTKEVSYKFKLLSDL